MVSDFSYHKELLLNERLRSHSSGYALDLYVLIGVCALIRLSMVFYD